VVGQDVNADRNCFAIDHLPVVLKRFTGLELTLASVHEALGVGLGHAASRSSSMALVPTESAAELQAIGEMVAYNMDRYVDFSPQQLVDTLVVRDMELEKMKQTMEQMRTKLRTATNRADQAENKLVEVRADAGSILSYAQVRKGLRKVCPFGGYTLALRRNKSGNASRQAAIDMMAGTDVQGGLKDGHVIARYEHFAAAAQRCMASDHHTDIDASVADALVSVDLHIPTEPAERPSQYIVVAVHAVQFKGDATNQEAIGKSKVHLSTLSSISLLSTMADLSLDQIDDLARTPVVDDMGALTITATISRERHCCAIQQVEGGTAAELYRMVIQEFKSVGCPTWEDRCNNAARSYLRRSEGVFAVGLRLFCFGFDHGADNVGFIRRVRQRLKEFPWLMMWVVWCFPHQYHLCVKSALCILDNTDQWSGSEEFNFKVKYFSSLATLTNVWRGVGAQKKIIEAAASKFGDVVGDKFTKLPCRCLRGRWGSIDEVEGLLIQVMPYLGPVLMGMYGADGGRTNRKRKSGAALPGADDDQRYSEEQKNYRQTAVQVSNNPFFKAMVIISFNAKSAHRHFLLWAQKRVRITNLRNKAASANGSTYVGPTFLSALVVSKAASIYNDISSLLRPASLNDPYVWGPALECLPDPASHSAGAIRLIVELVCQLACSWYKRFMQPCSEFPLMFLLVLETPADEPDEKRKTLADRLLKSRDQISNNPHDDISFKVLELYEAEWHAMARAGTCADSLWKFMLIFRSATPGETQDIEGFNSRLQWLTNLARRMTLPAADARMSIREGLAVSAEVMADRHAGTVQFMDSDQHVYRYAPIPVDDGPDVPRLPTMVSGGGGITNLLAAALALRAKQLGTIGSKYAYFIEQCSPGVCFLLSWTYYSKVFVVAATARAEGAGIRCTVDLPLSVRMLADVFCATPVCQGGGSLHSVVEVNGKQKRVFDKQLKFCKAPLVWDGMPTALVQMDSVEELILNVPMPTRKKPTPKPSTDAPLGDDATYHAEDAEDGAEIDAEGEKTLEAALESLVEELMETGDDGEADIDPVETGIAEEPVDHVLDEDGLEDEPDMPDLPDTDKSVVVEPSVTDPAHVGADETVMTWFKLADLSEQEAVRKHVALVVTTSLDEIEQARKLASASASDPMRDGVISLVEHCGQVLWVRWTDAAILEGRQVTVWGLQNSIKAIVAFKVPKVVYDGCQIIIPSTPATMLMRKKGDADRMPDWCMKLHCHAQAQHFTGPLAVHDWPESAKCVVCWGLQQCGADVHDVGLPSHRCATCTTVWHRECAQAFAPIGTVIPAGTFVCAICLS
jgi:hypothetical protein